MSTTLNTGNAYYNLNWKWVLSKIGNDLLLSEPGNEYIFKPDKIAIPETGKAKSIAEKKQETQPSN